MPVCTFCGNDNREDARSCVACGNVFDDDTTDTPPAPSAAEAAPATEPSVAGLATLYDARSVATPARQAMVMLGVAAALAVAVAVTVLVDAADARDTIRESPLLITPPEITPRTDFLTLAEVSIFAGALVMLAGWSQQLAANRSLLDTPRPRHSARWALRAWLIPGANVVLPGVLIRELWHDTTPPSGRRSPTLLLRMWPVLFGVALTARYAGLLYGFLASSELRQKGDVTVVAAILVIPLALWLAALAGTAALVRSLTARQVLLANSLSVRNRPGRSDP